MNNLSDPYHPLSKGVRGLVYDIGGGSIRPIGKANGMGQEEEPTQIVKPRTFLSDVSSTVHAAKGPVLERLTSYGLLVGICVSVAFFFYLRTPAGKEAQTDLAQVLLPVAILWAGLFAEAEESHVPQRRLGVWVGHFFVILGRILLGFFLAILFSFITGLVVEGFFNCARHVPIPHDLRVNGALE